MRFIEKDTTTAFDANASEFGPTDFFSIGVFESSFPEKSPTKKFQKFQSKPFFPWQKMMNSISVSSISVTFCRRILVWKDENFWSRRAR